MKYSRGGALNLVTIIFWRGGGSKIRLIRYFSEADENN